MPEAFERELAVFSAARRLPAAERAAYLDQTCAGEPALRQRVEELLRAGEDANAFLKEPAVGAQRPPDPSSATGLDAPGEKPGDRIGHYKLLQQIGEGGCGLVFMAEQEEPVRRRVALKVIKLGMDTKQVIARFEAERQALAMMDHPNIAKIYDAGATAGTLMHPLTPALSPPDGEREKSAQPISAGRPYFVMELVRGIKITEYCDEHNLSTKERLELFIQVCQAVQHAHQKGIIHRDLKPSNILVASDDGVPVPKVIDFGIAKATQGRLTDQTLFTAFEQFIGTPAYMSPEQAELTMHDVDTRTDIYSLGVLLYELLIGRTPFDTQELLASGLDTMRQTIREQEPVRPSTRLSTMLEGEQTNAARQRRTDVPKLIHLLRGDLDWIVMKCLEKDRNRRYETANGLARDLERFLADEPVVARPPSKLYGLQKMVRRHRLAFAAASAVIAALVIGLSLAAWQFVERSRAYCRAVTEAVKSQRVADLLKKMLEGVKPAVALGRDTTMLREIADKTAQSIGADLKDQPEVEIELRLTLAWLYLDLDERRKSAEMGRAALRVAHKNFGEESLSAADALSCLSQALESMGELNEAEACARRAIEMHRKLRGPDSLEEGLADFALANALYDSRRSETETAVRAAVAIYRKRLHGDNDQVARALVLLSTVLVFEGKLAEAEDVIREAIGIHERLNPAGDPRTAEAYEMLGDTIFYTGSSNRLPEAESALRKALAMNKRFVGKGKFSQVYTHDVLARVLEKQGKLGEAEVQYREYITQYVQEAKELPEVNDIMFLGYAQWRLSDLVAKAGRDEQAEQLRSDALGVFKRAAELLRKRAEGGNIGALNELAWLLATCPDASMRDGPRAVVLAGRAVTATIPKYGPYLDTLAAAYAEAGQFAEAVRVQKEAVALLRADEEKTANAYVSRLKLYESNCPFREGKREP
jgi:serine/threonine protein kinase/tetratricopeptide (TPR) repeat protein